MNFSDLPEVNFVETDVAELIEGAKKILEAELGRELSRGDPLLLTLKTFLSVIIQQREIINDLARQNLLAYARDNALDHIGVLVGCERLPAAAATCTVEVELSAAREKVTTIVAGTRVNSGDEVNFALDEAAVFAVGETVKTLKATCVEVGEIGNGYAIGELNKIVDPQPFLKSIKNVTASEGGADIESDDNFRERIRLIPESYSTAGSSGAYEYFTKAVSSLIVDVCATSPEPGKVNIYPLLEGGVLPDTEMLSKIADYLNDRQRRPLTDLVEVIAPEQISYDIELRYWIGRSDSAAESAIQLKAESAVEGFVEWQRQKLGRDVNPTELYWRLRSAGVKRAEIILPEFTVLDDWQVAVAGNITAIYAGVEDN